MKQCWSTPRISVGYHSEFSSIDTTITGCQFLADGIFLRRLNLADDFCIRPPQHNCCPLFCVLVHRPIGHHRYLSDFGRHILPHSAGEIKLKSRNIAVLVLLPVAHALFALAYLPRNNGRIVNIYTSRLASRQLATAAFPATPLRLLHSTLLHNMRLNTILTVLITLATIGVVQSRPSAQRVEERSLPARVGFPHLNPVSDTSNLKPAIVPLDTTGSGNDA